MAQIMEPMSANMYTFGGPHTPPHTPRNKFRVQRSGARAQSVHPAETTSPEKKQVVAAVAEDAVIVKEVSDGEIAAVPASELVLPYETEEQSDFATDEGDDAYSDDQRSSDAAGRDAGLVDGLARMQCDDKGEAEMHRTRQGRRRSRMESMRTWKRTHSASIKSESETSDIDALADHDLTWSARRTRRKVIIATSIGDAASSINSASDDQASPTTQFANKARAAEQSVRQSRKVHRYSNASGEAMDMSG